MAMHFSRTRSITVAESVIVVLAGRCRSPDVHDLEDRWSRDCDRRDFGKCRDLDLGNGRSSPHARDDRTYPYDPIHYRAGMDHRIALDCCHHDGCNHRRCVDDCRRHAVDHLQERKRKTSVWMLLLSFGVRTVVISLCVVVSTVSRST